MCLRKVRLGLTLMVLLLLIACTIQAQQSYVYGRITDESSGSPMAGVNIQAENTIGQTTDDFGNYNISLPPGNHILQFSFVGYADLVKKIFLNANDSLKLDLFLSPEAVTLNTAVVSAGLFMQKISDVSVSMAVIKPQLIQNRNSRSMESVLNQIPGVEVMDGQASIRGGGGYSYGAGSRVLLVLDELPLITADVGQVKWNFLPVETTAQVEILKGAASALYGSSALNGVINLRTVWPGLEPKTRINLYTGYYNKPIRKELGWWWESNPLFGGLRVSHAQKIKNLDLVAGMDAYSNDGFREMNYEEHFRFNVKLRYRPEKMKTLTYGISTNVQWQNTSDFFLWRNADSGAFLQQTSGVAPTKGFRMILDPWLQYFCKRNGKHSVRGRFYKVYNRFDNDADKNNGSELYYGEYRYYRKFIEKLDINIGLTGLYGNTQAELYGNHFNSNFAAFAQVDYKVTKRLSLSGGVRTEYYNLDNADNKISTVFRAGFNFKAAEYTYLRASFGQGYRYPSIAEKFTATSVGAINIFPNPDLQPETSWSSEVGLKQAYRIGTIQGFVDMAAFWTEYSNMIEFTFGIYKPDSAAHPTLKDIGFKSLNIGKARITGLDFNISGSGKIAGLNNQFFIGYTYMNPIDLGSDTLQNDILKYRFRHSVKADMQVDYQKFSFGFSFVYNSFMERIDAAFEDKILGQEIFPGLKIYRQEHNKGAVVFDIRTACRITTSTELSFIVNNLFNKEYMGRPGDIRPPRNFTLKFVLQL